MLPSSHRHRSKDTPAAGGDAPELGVAAAVSDVEVERRLRSRGVKATLSRVHVMRALLDNTPADGCMTPEEVYLAVDRQGGGIAISQVYSILSGLADAGLIDRYRMGEGPNLLAPRRGQRWAALSLCMSCQQVRGIRNAPLETQLARLGETLNFRIDEPTVVLRGQCTPCLVAAARLS